MLDVLHLHGFKCAGTTFAWILEKNYPGQVAYVESDAPDARLPWQIARSGLASPHWRAATSHLCSMPPEGNVWARITVALVREPRQRICSGYRFEQRRGTVPAGESFPHYLERLKDTELNNYQTRHLSPQDDGGWLAMAGWQARPDLIDLKRQDLFVGLVEEFDMSMVLLERRLAGLDIPFDAAYHTVHNRSEEEPAPAEMLESIPRAMVELDDELYARARDALRGEWAEMDDADARLADFRRRSAEAASLEDAVRIKRAKDWIRVDPVTGAALPKETIDVPA